MTSYDWLETLDLHGEPQSDSYCGRCGGPAGPEGAWCDNCIRECREYTRWLDSPPVGGAR